MCCLFVNLSISIFGNKVRTTGVLSVLLFYKCFFSVERGDIIRFFAVVNSKKKKRCKYNSINYIETIKKERIKNIFVRESVPGSLMVCGWRWGGTRTKSVTETEEHPAARPTPRQVRTLVRSSCLCDRPKNCISVIPAY